MGGEKNNAAEDLLRWFMLPMQRSVDMEELATERRGHCVTATGGASKKVNKFKFDSFSGIQGGSAGLNRRLFRGSLTFC